MHSGVYCVYLRNCTTMAQIDKIRKRLSGSLDGAAAEEDGDIRQKLQPLEQVVTYLKYSLFSLWLYTVYTLHLSNCTQSNSGLIYKSSGHTCTFQ
jgi:hypothetical protein